MTVLYNCTTSPMDHVDYMGGKFGSELMTWGFQTLLSSELILFHLSSYSMHIFLCVMGIILFIIWAPSIEYLIFRNTGKSLWTSSQITAWWALVVGKIGEGSALAFSQQLTFILASDINLACEVERSEAGKSSIYWADMICPTHMSQGQEYRKPDLGCDSNCFF